MFRKSVSRTVFLYLDIFENFNPSEIRINVKSRNSASHFDIFFVFRYFFKFEASAKRLRSKVKDTNALKIVTELLKISGGLRHEQDLN